MSERYILQVIAIVLVTSLTISCSTESESRYNSQKAHALGGADAIGYSRQQNSDIVNGKIKEDAPSAQFYNLEDDFSPNN